MLRQRNHRRAVRRLLAIAGVLGVGALSACGGQPQQSQPSVTAAQVQGQTGTVFTFAPPQGTHYIRTETKTSESSIAGTPFRHLVENQLQWSVDVNRTSDGYTIHQDLSHVTLKTNEKTVADAMVPKGTIAIDLLTDSNGNLNDVTGLEQASKSLVSMADPDSKDMAMQVFSPAALRTTVQNRYDALVSEFIGRPAHVGASWTLAGDSSQMIKSRKITVEGVESCGTAMCDRLRMDADVDTKAVTEAANDVVKQYVTSKGSNASSFSVKQATDAVHGSLVVEPSTLLAHGASLDETKRATVSGPNRTFDVNFKDSTRFDYDYGSAPQAMLAP